MKKFLYPALALSALALASCSSEEPVAGNGDSVTFNVTIPGSLSSRATLGDQILAPVDNLQWTVYEVNGETKTAVYTASFEGTPFAGGKTTETVTLNLGKGKTYQVVFYADNADNGAVSFTNGVLSVDYDAMATNTLAEDAFVGTSEAVVAGDPTNTVQLIRPFAQLNWGTSDLNDPVVAKYINPADGVTALTAQVTVTGTLYKSFDVISNTFSDEVTDATFGAVTAADFSAYETDGQKVTFPAVGGTETYSLLAMNYLMPGTQGTATCTLAFNNGFESVEVNSVTLKQNFRTNIYGALLTNPTEFNVQIAPAFEEGDNNVEVVNAKPVSTPEEVAEAVANGGEYVIAAPMETLDLSNLNPAKPLTINVNKAVTTMTLGASADNTQPVTINVAKDVAYPAITLAKNSSLKNVTLTGDVTSSEKCAGLNFYGSGVSVDGFTVKNVPFTGTGVYVFYPSNTSATVQNLTVEGCSFTEMETPAVDIQTHGNAADNIGNITVRNNTISFGPKPAKPTSSAITILNVNNGPMVIEGNTILDSHYHGLYITSNSEMTITNNSIAGVPEDGIKMDTCSGEMTLTGNTIEAEGNGIRFKNISASVDVTVTGNTINMTEAKPLSGGEPYGILFAGVKNNASPLIIVKDNKKVGSPADNNWFNIDYTPAAGSEYSNPFVD